MSEVHKDVASEPVLMPLTGKRLPDSTNKSDDARADLSVRSFWQDGQKAFFDVKFFNPFAKTHLKSELQQNFETIKKEEKRAYNHPILQLEHGSFSPLVFSVYGGSGRARMRFEPYQTRFLGREKLSTPKLSIGFAPRFQKN